MKKQFLNLFLIGLVSFLLSGCSRDYFEPNPKTISKPIYLTHTLPSHIEYFNQTTGTLKNGMVIPSNKILPKGFVAISNNLSKKGNILKIDNKNIKFNSLIVTASKKDNLIGIIFGDNHFELYDLNKNKTIFSQSLGQSLANMKFITKPYFYKDLLLIPSLNGKVYIYDLKQNKMLKDILVSQKDYFNNIIFLSVKDDTLIIGSRDNLMLITPTLTTTKSYNIKHILVDDSGIYVFTIEGDIKKLNFVGKELKSQTLKYANIIFPMFYKNKIYFLTRGDKSFLVKMDKNLNLLSITPLKVYVKDDDCYKDKPIYLKTDVFGSNGFYYIGDYILKIK